MTYDEHIRQLAADLRVGVVTRPREQCFNLGDMKIDMWGYYNLDERCIVLTKSINADDGIAYAIALHELGHAATLNKCEDYSSQVWNAEVAAWIWACAHALEWTPVMQALRDCALNTYLPYKPVSV